MRAAHDSALLSVPPTLAGYVLKLEPLEVAAVITAENGGFSTRFSSDLLCCWEAKIAVTVPVSVGPRTVIRPNSAEPALYAHGRSKPHGIPSHK